EDGIRERTVTGVQTCALPICKSAAGEDVYLQDIWPTTAEIQAVVDASIEQKMFIDGYQDVFAGDEHWQALATPQSEKFQWDPESTYVRNPPYFEGMPSTPAPLTDITGARVLALLGESVTTDHISPAGSIGGMTPAALYLTQHGVKQRDFNSYGSR